MVPIESPNIKRWQDDGRRLPRGPGVESSFNHGSGHSLEFSRHLIRKIKYPSKLPQDNTRLRKLTQRWT